MSHPEYRNRWRSTLQQSNPYSLIVNEKLGAIQQQVSIPKPNQKRCVHLYLTNDLLSCCCLPSFDHLRRDCTVVDDTMTAHVVQQHSSPSCSTHTLFGQPRSMSVDDDIGVVTLRSNPTGCTDPHHLIGVAMQPFKGAEILRSDDLLNKVQDGFESPASHKAARKIQ